MIKIIKKFLPQDLLTEILQYAEDNKNLHTWRTNLTSWNNTIVQKGHQVAILKLDDFSERLKSLYEEKGLIEKNLKIAPMFYIWSRGSYIPFHKDSHMKAASTIYLNDLWDLDDGGLFLWKDEENKLHVEEPEENKMIFNSNSIPHAVSMITSDSLSLRLSIQIFFTNS